MKKIVLFPHGGSGNHGCEAIVRTTVKLLEQAEVFLFSENVQEDLYYLSDMDIHIASPHKSIRKYSPGYFAGKYRMIIKNEKDAMDAMSFSPLIDLCDDNTVLLSIGGDNYCYGDNEYIFLVNREVRKKRTKTVLWGASVDEQIVSDKMKQDLQGYSLIIARESISYNYLKTINEHVLLLPDPAFSLESNTCVADEEIFDEKVIGINMSPMIIGYERQHNIAYDNYRYLVTKIIETTSNNIALIPHVIWNHNDDRIPLKQLYEEFKDSGRVFLIQDQNCMQLKKIISKCCFFVGARTHSTIAAYSTSVPTLVVGYSVKARGIALDLFGTEKDYVIPVQRLKTKTDLYDAFVKLYDQTDSISNTLRQKNETINNAMLNYKKVLYEEI